ncbi:MAG: choice-of-anchor D domain-containing protein [Myxococcota bacterium]
MSYATFSLRLSLLALSSCLWLACQSGYESQKLPILGLEYAGEPLSDGELVRLTVLPPESEEGALVARLSVLNVGVAMMDIRAIRIEGEASRILAVRLDGTLGLMKPDDPPRTIALIRKAGVGEPAAGELLIETNETLNGERMRRVPLVLHYPGGQLMTNPSVVEFGATEVGEPARRSLDLINTGKAPLVITSMGLSGHRGFSIFEGDGSLLDGADEERVQLDPPIRLAPGGTHALKVHYAAATADSARSELQVVLANEGGVKAVPLSANASLPCLSVNPHAITFGGKVPGTTGRVDVEVKSCGDEPLIIEGGRVQNDTAQAFQLEAILQGDAAVQLPMTLGINESITLRLRFTPPALSPTDEAGERVPFKAELQLSSNAIPAQRNIPIEGLGVEVECPTAKIVIPEGEEVIPQTLLHLDGTQSYGAVPIVGYEWTVDQPPGSVGVFAPSALAPSPQFSADVAGLYTFHLKVRDANGESCGPAATAQVLVVPDDALHIELLWSTPGDTVGHDNGYEVGTDLDLHLVHPFAAGIDIDGDGSRDGYFDIPFDCFWSNVAPVWGSMANAASHPRLDRDDTDGGGPENMNIDSPQDGITYRVGVHYWDDHDFGPSFATVRVYVYGNLVYEAADVRLVKGDLWDALTIEWPSGNIARKSTSEDAPVIYPMTYSDEFPHP